MKIYTLFFFSALLVFSNVQSQVAWPDEEAEWYLHSELCFTPNVLTHFEVSGTEMIEGKECTVLHRTTYTAWQGSYESDHYVYFNGDTVFWYSEENFYPLLCFNLEEGDVWYPLPEDTLQTGPNCVYSGMMIDNKSTVEYNGQMYRQITISPEVSEPVEWDDPWPSIVWFGTFNERTFVKTEEYASSWFFPQYNICDAVVEWNCPTFACYSDSELNIQATEEACDHPLTVSVHENPSKESILIYPNPVVSGQPIYIDGIGNFKEIRIFSTNGKMIHQSNSVSNNYSVLIAPPPGSYILQSIWTDGTVGHSKMVVIQ